MNDLMLSDLKSEISIGKITTNAAEMLAAVRKGVEKYHDENYIPNEASAKSDRAELNRLEKAISAEARRVRVMYNAPLEEFNGLVAEITSSIKGAVQVVDGAAKAYEEKQKAEKHNEIQAYFDGKNFVLAPLEKIFNYRWLNKTVKMAEIKKEIDDTISMIYTNIKILESIAEHGIIAKAFYLDTLDMGAAMRRVDALKENTERLAREKIEREERERQALISINNAIEREEAKEAEKKEAIKSLVDEALCIEEPETQIEPEIIEYTLRFRGTKEQLFKLREYMTVNGIVYEKIEGK